VPAGSSDLVTLDRVQERLRPRTALVLIFEAMWIDGSTATWQLVISRGLVHAAVGREDMPFGTTQTSWHGRSLIMSARGLLVADLRRGLQQDPGPLDVSGDAADLLISQRALYLRAVDEVRDQLVGEGVDHLLFVGHGPSHYLPMHMLTDGSRVLADDWTVTYLLNLAQLSTPTAPAREDVAVFGLAYSDQPALPRLDDSVDEAQAIARVCAVEPKINEAATEEAFVDALRSCRYVHLRAHGRMYVDAPSFHTVFLHPTDAHDGRLRAYEVVGLDLAGLELVTLGACETAVGRVDRYDNPRGLPSALLLAGARAVIGTFWPVLAAASTLFFTTLYRGLITNNLDLTTAFAGAQQSTRAQFPQHRDWGAFYLIGGQ
jgi:CHAT domain-containing protein